MMIEQRKMENTFKTWISHYQAQAEAALERYLPTPSQKPARLHEAMRYSVLGGGKRMRPLLTYAAGEAVGADPRVLDAPACAVEMIHAYSLIHDDLPAMDNDDLRRGKPTCHKAYDEAMAILAGDALQALAFDLLAREPNLAVSAARRVQMIETLSQASGSLGMAGGQAIDLAAVGQRLSVEELEDMHRHKTGALISASCRLGALAQETADDVVHDRLDPIRRLHRPGISDPRRHPGRGGRYRLAGQTPGLGHGPRQTHLPRHRGARRVQTHGRRPLRAGASICVPAG